MRAEDMRNAEIVAAVAGGERPVDVAARFGVSRQRVNQIVHRRVTNARKAITNALTRGHLVRPDHCERCGEPGEVEAHHADYDDPLMISWLCVPCHGATDVASSTRKKGGRPVLPHQPYALSEEETVAFRVALEREIAKRNLNGVKLSRLVGVSPARIWMLRFGGAKNVTYSMVSRLASALDAPTSSLLPMSNVPLDKQGEGH